jgi:hypothetical protein
VGPDRTMGPGSDVPVTIARRQARRGAC